MSTMGENEEDEDEDDTGASEADFDQVCSQTQFFIIAIFSNLLMPLFLCSSGGNVRTW